jgi:hypothetical protein
MSGKKKGGVKRLSASVNILTDTSLDFLYPHTKRNLSALHFAAQLPLRQYGCWKSFTGNRMPRLSSLDPSKVYLFSGFANSNNPSGVGQTQILGLWNQGPIFLELSAR